MVPEPLQEHGNVMEGSSADVARVLRSAECIQVQTHVGPPAWL